MEQVGFWIKTPKDKPFQAGDQGAETTTFLLSPLLGSFSEFKSQQSILSPLVAYES